MQDGAHIGAQTVSGTQRPLGVPDSCAFVPRSVTACPVDHNALAAFVTCDGRGRIGKMRCYTFRNHKPSTRKGDALKKQFADIMPREEIDKKIGKWLWRV